MGQRNRPCVPKVTRVNQRRNEFVPVILNLMAATGVLLISFSVKMSTPIFAIGAKRLGLFLVIVGAAFKGWAAIQIKEAFWGKVEPELEVLVTSGPYKFVRHPMYLGMTIAYTGLPVALRSWLGLLAVVLLFLPSEIYRARLEDKALHSKFGPEWERYAARTGFMWPRLGKRK